MLNLGASGPARDLPYKLTPLAPHHTPLAKNIKCIMSKLWVCRYNCDGHSFPKSWVGGVAIAASCQFMDHPPHPCAWAPGKPGPMQIHMLLYRLLWCMALDRAPHRLETHTNNTSCMPLQGTTKPCPFDWLAIMSKNQLKCTKQLLCRVNIMSKQKTSSVIMSVLWVYYEWDLPKHLMHFWCAGAMAFVNFFTRVSSHSCTF